MGNTIETLEYIEWKNNIIFILILLILFFFTILFVSLELLSSKEDIVYSGHIKYKGFDIYGNNFNEIKKVIDNLKITKKDYPSINKIVSSNNPSCDGLFTYFPETKERTIFITKCNRDAILFFDINKDKPWGYITQKEWIYFVLAHELGHYVQSINKYELDEGNANDYAYNLSKKGVKY